MSGFSTIMRRRNAGDRLTGSTNGLPIAAWVALKCIGVDMTNSTNARDRMVVSILLLFTVAGTFYLWALALLLVMHAIHQ
jgi:hypothetical protein